MSRLKDWGQTIAVIGAIVGTVVACFVFMQTEHTNMRVEMRAGFAELRDAMRGEHAEMRDQLNSVDRRTARMEGRLFGIEIPQEPADEE